MKSYKLCAVAALLAASAFQSALADPITIIKNTSISVTVEPIKSLVRFQDMVGQLQVTAYFGGIGTTLTWANLGGGLSGVQGTGWSLSGNSTEDTFSGLWTLTNTGGTALTALQLYGGQSVIIDTAAASPGVPGTDSGTDLTGFGTDAATATYSVAVKPLQTPQDAFLLLNVTGICVGSSCASGLTSTTFIQDTDMVPELDMSGIPGGIALLGGTMALLAEKRRREQRG